MNLFFFVSGAKLSGVGWTVGWLWGDASVGDVWVSEFMLEDAFVPFFFDAFCGWEHAGPIADISEFDGGISYEFFFPVDFFE